MPSDSRRQTRSMCPRLPGSRKFQLITSSSRGPQRLTPTGPVRAASSLLPANAAVHPAREGVSGRPTAPRLDLGRVWQVSCQAAEPCVDHPDLDGGFVAYGEFLKAGGHGAVLFEQVDAAFGGVAALVDLGGERWRPPAGPAPVTAVADLISWLGDGRGDPATA